MVKKAKAKTKPAAKKTAAKKTKRKVAKKKKESSAGSCGWLNAKRSVVSVGEDESQRSQLLRIAPPTKRRQRASVKTGYSLYEACSKGPQ
jgi:hypothetical protein